MFKRLAVVTGEFEKLVKRLVHTCVWRSPAFKGGHKYLSVFSVLDPENPEDPGYFYVQRVGVNSVAFLLWDSATGRYHALEQFHSPQRRFVKGAFTGSMEKPDIDATQTVIEEVAEEAGYTVDRGRVHLLTQQPVSGNTDETVFLFVVDITGLEQHKPAPENIFEENTNIHQVHPMDIIPALEWKAQLIFVHHNLDPAVHLVNTQRYHENV